MPKENEVIIRTKVEAESANKSLKQTAKGVEEVENASGNLSGQLDSMTGGAITFGRNLVKSAKMGVASMRTLKGALISTGIGALVVAVGTLITYFSQSKEGMELFDKASAALGATVRVLIDRIVGFYTALFKIISGDVKEGLADLVTNFQGIGEEIVNDTVATWNLVDAQQALVDTARELSVETATTRTEIRRLNMIAEDMTKSIEERSKASNKAMELEEELMDKRLKQAKEEQRILEERAALEGTERIETLDELAEKEIEIQQLVMESLEQQTTLQNKRNELAAQYNALLEEQLFIQRLQKDAEFSEEDKLEPIDAKMLKSKELTFEAIKANELDYEKFQEKQRQDILDEELRIEQQRASALVSIRQSVQGSLMALLEEGSMNQRAVAASGALIDTFAAINGTLKNTARNPVTGALPGYAIAQAIATGAFGMIQVGSILKTDPVNGAGGGVSISGGSGGRAAPPPAPDTAPDFGFLNEGVSDRSQTGRLGAKTYVTNKDIKDVEKQSRKLKDISRVR